MYKRATPPPLNGQSFNEYLVQELEQLERAFALFDHIRLKELNSAPARPRTGMVVLADGTNWNPGSGAGFYGYYGGTWSKLG